jgi:hypothetical protein
MSSELYASAPPKDLPSKQAHQKVREENSEEASQQTNFPGQRKL